MITTELKYSFLFLNFFLCALLCLSFTPKVLSVTWYNIGIIICIMTIVVECLLSYQAMAVYVLYGIVLKRKMKRLSLLSPFLLSINSKHAKVHISYVRFSSSNLNSLKIYLFSCLALQSIFLNSIKKNVLLKAKVEDTLHFLLIISYDLLQLSSVIKYSKFLATSLIVNKTNNQIYNNFIL